MSDYLAYTSDLGDRPPLRVMQIVAAGEFGGAETQILALLRALREYPVQVLVATFYDGEFAKRARELGIAVQVLSAATPIHDYFQVKKAALRFAPQVIHTHGVRASVAGRLFGDKLDIPVVTTVHSDLYYDYDQPVKRALMMTMEYFTREQSTRVIAVSAALARTLQTRGYSADQIAVITNGIDVAQAERAIGEAKKHPAQIKDHLNIPADAHLVISVARLQPVKHLSALINAVAGIRTVAGHPVHLLLVGDGPDREALTQQAVALASQEGSARIHLLGQRHDVVALLLEAQVFALPSLMEGMPISIMEAMSCGLPVVASGVGGIPDVVEIGGGATGILVPPTDEKALQAAITSLLQDDKQRQHMGQQAQRRVREHFSLAQMVAHTHDAYLNMAK